jgi:aminoglycoside phosphotransferase (APT) family kinase protein
MSSKLVPTPVDAAEAAFVARLADSLGAGRATLVGEGFSNWVYRLETCDGQVALKLGKPHRLASTAGEYRKDIWCANAAADAGVGTPRALAVGRFEDRPCLLQAFAPGPRSGPGEGDRIWRALGSWARAIHAIPISGWGDRLVADGVFAGDWAAHLAYNLGALEPDDPLIALGVLDAAQSADLKRRFERLARAPFRIGLCHGDLAAFNVLVDDDAGGALALIDWGCAFAAPVPHYEINEILREDRATVGELALFRHAYGLSDAAWAEIQTDLLDLRALREVDTLRWALAHLPSEAEAYTRRAVAALACLR